MSKKCLFMIISVRRRKMFVLEEMKVLRVFDGLNVLKLLLLLNIVK